MNRISEDVTKVRMYLGPGIMYTINLSILFIMAIYNMVQISAYLTIFVLLPLPIMSFIIYKVSSKINKISTDVQAEQSFMSTVAECYAHIPLFGQWLYTQDQQPGYDYLKQLLQFLQWQKRRAGLTGSRWLLKTPHHLHYPEHLLRTFPGAQVIQCHRHPLAVIPSYASMMYSLTAPFTDHCDKHAIAKHWSDKWHAGLNTTMAYRSQHPEIPYLDLQFDDSVSDPEGTVKRVYDFVGAELTPTALAEMTRWREFNRREQRPEHHYSLEEYGFTAAAISEQFADYIDCHIRT